MVKRASKLLEQGEPLLAAELIAPHLDKASVPAPLFHYGCRAYEEANNRDSASRCWQQGHRHHPHDPLIIQSLAELWLGQQRFAEVAKLLSKVPRAKQDLALRYLHGYALYQLKEYAKTLSVLTLDNNPQGKTQQPYHWWPIKAYALLALERWQGLNQLLKAWLSQPNLSHSDELQAWQLLAQSHLQQQHFTQAAAALETVRLLQPHSQSHQKALLTLYGQLQAFDLASECLALPGDALSLNCLYFGLWSGHYQQSFDASERMVKGQELTSTEQDQLTLLQGQLLAALGKATQARAKWQQVGTGTLSGRDANTLKTQRQQRLRHRAQALLAIAQSHWLSGQWPEAELSYRELGQLNGYHSTATGLIRALNYYTQPQ